MNKTAIILLLTSILLSCSDAKQAEKQQLVMEEMQVKLDSLKAVVTSSSSNTELDIATFLTFQDNNAENAMNFYMSIFENSKVLKIERWGKGGPGTEGRVMHAIFELNGNLFMASDSPPIHEWNFTPAVSNYIDCTTEGELDMLFGKLSENGKVMMPLNNYGFSRKFGFLEDQYGVSWQLNLK